MLISNRETPDISPIFMATGAALQRLIDQDADYYFVAGDLANWGRGLDQFGTLPAALARIAFMSCQAIMNRPERSGASAISSAFTTFTGSLSVLDGHTHRRPGLLQPHTASTRPANIPRQELAQRLTLLGNPEILICHCPPKNTQLDLSGKDAFRKSIRPRVSRTMQPDYFFCGHIHEAAGASERFGKTQGWNVGKAGYLLEL